MTARRIAFFTSTRAEYGLLRPLMAEVASRPGLSLQTIVAGTHLSEEYGETWRDIAADGFSIDARINMRVPTDDAVGFAASAALALTGTAEALARLQPDVLVLLGDRYELLAAAQAAVLARIPIAHIHGGEATEGAIDDSIRHAITKLAHLHFPAAQAYAERILQMGESPDRVWTVGAPAMDNIANLDPMPLETLEAFIGMPLRAPAFLVTYHPVTLAGDGGLAAMDALLIALDERAGSIVITGTNADPGAAPIRKALQAFAHANAGRIALVESLGVRRYLSLMHHVDAVVGNSSSGLLEAPAIGVPTVDIGARQRGRLRAPSVIHCDETASSIRQALNTVLTEEHRQLAARRDSPYGRPGAAKRIVDVLQSGAIDTLCKPFVDRPSPEVA
ncbi:MAG: UDP-N-acetylglucosamine 2-epimerase (hydrolyzing) [Paucibacter sp.]|nr:UDP-N-acetylglucosamine 2-epimerase (hydrolyzing) [Roseateles sp.]